ncbi:hypothetical protein [Pelagibacterium sp. H642]|uniref:hypothetical protein n=1 Tax=Pelagibacterium sp. H642 TaxID=1881069 RepID=UPI0028163755|nr:hypothetical protein [Pelagibacterium sp. H642]WMT90114.1 hypothetical protein NO934_15145 [Pelagibacterium sp. H642]
MAHWAAKGVLCECIDDGAWVAVTTMERIAGPKKGDRLVVAEVEVRGALVIIGFKEYGHGRWGFDASSFRPITTIKSDLAIFAHHLDQNSIHVSEPA